MYAASPLPPSPAAARFGNAEGGGSSLAPGPMGSAALYAEYQHCLARLEGLINGELSHKRAALLDCAAAVERNMGEVRRAEEAVQRENSAEAAGIAERLHAKSKHKLSVLQHELSAYLVDVQAIDGFIGGVVRDVSEPPARVSAAAHAQALLSREHELVSKAQRLAIKPHAPPAAVASDDLPREAVQSQARQEVLVALEEQLRRKERQLDAMAQRLEATAKAQTQAAEYAERAHAYAEAVQNGSHAELLEWAAIADASARRIEELELEAHATRHEADELRGQNGALRSQNESLREHCEELRRMVLSAAAGGAGGLVMPPLAAA
jgi:hypothetical protein